jgi:hypothetical protein
VTSNGYGRGKARIAALGAACAIGVTGLVLAVGAGAQSGKSVRDASYPVSYTYEIKITGAPGKARAATDFKNHSTFRWHVVYASTGEKPPRSQLKYIHYKCKLDKRHKKGCDSPKTYTGLSKGKHKFGVQALYKVTNTAASAVKKVRFKIG